MAQIYTLFGKKQAFKLQKTHTMGKNFSSELILERIKTAYKLKNNSELARFLGVKPNTISNWYSRNSIDFDILFSKCEGISLDWLINGEINTKSEPITSNELNDSEHESFLKRCPSEKEIMNLISANGYTNLLFTLVGKMGKLNQHIDSSYNDLWVSMDLAVAFLKHYSLSDKFANIYEDFVQNKISFNELKNQTKRAFIVEKELFFLIRDYKETINKMIDLITTFNDAHDKILSYSDEVQQDNSKP